MLLKCPERRLGAAESIARGEDVSNGSNADLRQRDQDVCLAPQEQTSERTLRYSPPSAKNGHGMGGCSGKK